MEGAKQNGLLINFEELVGGRRIPQRATVDGVDVASFMYYTLNNKNIAHVIEADHAYAREIGIRVMEPTFGDRAAVEAERTAVLELLRQPSDGDPLADRKWTLRYAARRIAWHALDHAWEMEDRSEQG